MSDVVAVAAIAGGFGLVANDVKRLAADLRISEAEARRLIEVANYSDKVQADGRIVTV